MAGRRFRHVRRTQHPDSQQRRSGWQNPAAKGYEQRLGHPEDNPSLLLQVRQRRGPPDRRIRPGNFRLLVHRLSDSESIEDALLSVYGFDVNGLEASWPVCPYRLPQPPLRSRRLPTGNRRPTVRPARIPVSQSLSREARQATTSSQGTILCKLRWPPNLGREHGKEATARRPSCSSTSGSWPASPSWLPLSSGPDLSFPVCEAREGNTTNTSRLGSPQLDELIGPGAVLLPAFVFHHPSVIYSWASGIGPGLSGGVAGGQLQQKSAAEATEPIAAVRTGLALAPSLLPGVPSLPMRGAECRVRMLSWAEIDPPG